MQISLFLKKSGVKVPALLVTAAGLLLFAQLGYADETTQTGLGAVAQSALNVFATVVEAIAAAAYVAGVGFGIGAIMKFKQHKDNPTQIPIGTPIALLFISVALVFLPTVIDVTGKTLFKGGKTGGSGGTGVSILQEQSKTGK